jgi:hypothetical protein
VGVGVALYGASQVRTQGHSYEVRVRLGRTKMTAGQIARVAFGRGAFPIDRDHEGLEEGDTFNLIFWGRKNPVRVLRVTDDSVLLEALQGHAFEGTAEHKILVIDGHAYYVVTGRGRAGEKLGRCLANRAFGTGFWPLLVKSRTQPAVQAMDGTTAEILSRKESALG